jgi:anaerobic selenocysteine-containing dehydrogenase
MTAVKRLTLTRMCLGVLSKTDNLLSQTNEGEFGMTQVQKRTFCRVCEPACGLVATVEDNELVKLEADKEHPISKGFVCNKGIYGLDIHNDPDRLRTPLKRNASGELAPISWPDALAEISAKLKTILEQSGSPAIAAYQGNPGAFNTLLGPSFKSFVGQLGITKFFSSGTQDCSNKYAASEGVFGSRTIHPLPDLEYSDFILIIGENPAVSHMSFMSIPNPMGHLKAAVKRGADVVYLNPRTIESASIAGRVVHIKPDTDAYLLAAVLNVIDTEHGFHPNAERDSTNLAELRSFIADYSPQVVAGITGISADAIRELAGQFNNASSAAVHMSTGANMGRQGTLTYWLVHMLSFVTGNLGVRGGNFYSMGFYERAYAAGTRVPDGYHDTPYGDVRAPGGIGINLPGNLMSDYLADENDPVRALLVSSGNPVLSIAGEEKLRTALEKLELIVCVDIYRNATAEYAHYILPAAGAFEREDINITGLGMQFQPSVQFTEAMVSPGYERKPDWWIFESLAKHLGMTSALTDTAEPNMWARVDAMLASRGNSLAQLKEDQIIALERSTPDEFFERVQHPEARIDCCPSQFDDAIVRMQQIFTELKNEPETQLKLITKRDSYMFNSWYANVDKLKQKDRQTNYLFMHPQDAELRQIGNGDLVRVDNENGALSTEVKFADDLMPGVVAMSHGWGHKKSKGMKVAASKPGVNCNVLLPSGTDSYEPLSSQAHMTGIPVDVRRTV